MSGAEVSVWRYLIGSVCLLLVSVSLKGSRDLITPLRRHGMQITILSVFGMALGQLLFHWSLDFASVTQVATMVTTMPMGVVVMDFIAQLQSYLMSSQYGNLMDKSKFRFK